MVFTIIIRFLGRIEKEEITNILGSRGLKIHEIEPDGDCLYNAVAHQLSSSNKKVI